MRRHLSDGGVFGQWLHLYEMDDDLVIRVLAALHRTFPDYALYFTDGSDMLVVASARAPLAAPDWSVLRHPAIAADLERVVPLTAQTLNALRFADRATFAPLLDVAVPPNSDYHPALDLGAERARYLARNATEFIALGAMRFDPFAALAGRRTPLPDEPMTAVPNVTAAREAALAGRLRGPPARGGAVRPPDDVLDGAELRHRLFAGFLTAAVPPPDWRTWTRTAALAEAGFHGPAQGEANERFYGLLRAYLARTGPPARVATALAFLHALATWDFSRAAAVADTMLPEALQGDGWLPDDLFRDGAVVAKLKVGDVRGARVVFDEMKPVLGDRVPLRSSLLSAHLRKAEALAMRARATAAP